MFLQDCQTHLDSNSGKKIADIYAEFCNKHGLDGDASYSYPLINQGLVLTALYGLLVYPQELWEKDKEMGTNFAFFSRRVFNFSDLVEHPKSIWSEEQFRSLVTYDFIRRIRHSIAHANVSIGTDSQRYLFWNLNRRDEKDFEVSASHQEIGGFITEIAKYFTNEVSSTSSSKTDISLIPYLGPIS